MIVGRRSPRGGSVTILAPTAQAAAAALAPEIVVETPSANEPPKRHGIWRSADRVATVEQLIRLAHDAFSWLTFRRQAAKTARIAGDARFDD